MELQPYLFFRGNCEEALDFYKRIFGGEVTQLSRFKDAPPDPEHPRSPADDQRIMHATFTSPDFSFMASDAQPGKEYGEGPISLSIGLSDVKVAQRLFDGLAQGGNVEMPLSDMFWGAKFGMLTDKFGIDWMVNCQLEGASVN
jgi:PhnB protein